MTKSVNGTAPGWKRAKLSELCNINPRSRPPATLIEENPMVSFVPMSSVQAQTGRMDPSASRCLADVLSGYTSFINGDVLFAKITPCMENGKVAIAKNLHNEIGFGSTEFHVLRPSPGLDARFLFYYLIRQKFRIEAKRNMTGTAGQLRVPALFLIDAPIELPPFAEQRRIADELDALFSDLEVTTKTLERALEKLKHYRKAVLKSAVEGELSREWRESHRDQIEPASELLKRILEERRRHWEESELAKMRANGIKPKDSEWKHKYVEPECPNDDTRVLLPKGWNWVRLGQMGVVMGGLTKNPKREKILTKLPYLRVGNVYAGELRLEDLHEIGVEPMELKRVLLEKGDLLVVEGNGSAGQIGRVAVWDGSIKKCVHQNHIIKVRFPFPELSAWSALFLLSPTGRDLIQKVASSTSGLYTLSISKVSNLLVALPPLEEQILIQNETRRAISIVDKLTVLLEANLRRATRLRQSILEKAFRGELVVQDPNDEPASVLLERIRAQRAAGTVAKPTRARKAKA